MKKNIFTALAILLSTSLFVVSCNDKEKEEVVTTPKTGKITLQFEHLWADKDFALNTEFTHPDTKEQIIITMLKYYITNVKFKNTDGTWWSEPESYHLVDASTASAPELTILDVPSADYTDVSYTIGVDSTRNVSGAQSGALSTTNNMFWSWNTGYIFVKIEGTSPAAKDSAFLYHLGGFKSPTSAIQINTQSFNGSLLGVNNSATPVVHMAVDLEKVWTNGVTLESVYKIHMPGASAQTLAQNFGQAIKFEHIHN